MSIKQVDLAKGTNLYGRVGISDTPDGLCRESGNDKNAHPAGSYGIDIYQLSGVLDPVAANFYDVDAKFDSSVADALQTLSPNDG